MSSYYLPKCCACFWDGTRYIVVHYERDRSNCHHVPSGGTAGYQDGKTPCNRVVGRGSTKIDAIADARAHFEMGAI